MSEGVVIVFRMTNPLRDAALLNIMTQYLIKMIWTLTMVMMDSVSVVTSCSPRRAMSSTEVSVMQWAAVTCDKTGFRLFRLCTVVQSPAS